MVIIITGASKGIGFALSESFARQGHRIYGFSRQVVNSSIFSSFSVDVTDKEEIQRAVDTVIAREGKIDILINNAGMGMVGAVEDTTKEDIHKLFDLNLAAPVQMISAILPKMREQSSGRIINISSIGSEMGLPFRGFYSASKSALDKVTEALRYEIKKWNIQATVLHLGDIKTNIADSRIRTKVSGVYKMIFSKVYDQINANVSEGNEPLEVAEYITFLLKKKKWKPHYYYGKFEEKIGIPLKFILPQNLYENLIRKYSKME